MKLTIIRLASENGEVLETTINQFARDGFIYELKNILKYENIWEFEFIDPTETSMFNLGVKYGWNLAIKFPPKETA